MTPAVFLAYTFDPKHPLFSVSAEGQSINTIVNEISEWKCLSFQMTNLNVVTDYFSKGKDFSFQVFHFAGHAVDKSLQFNDGVSPMDQMAISQPYMVNVGGLSQIIKERHPVQLVFLNGCSTKTQVEAFKNAGIPAVIYTTKPLFDRIGTGFAKKFYLAFFKENSTLQEAFNIANGHINGKINLGDSENWLDPEIKENMCRGITSLDALPIGLDEQLYELSASDEFKNMRWSDWPSFKAVCNQVIQMNNQPDPQDLQSKQIPDAVIHRCDRVDEFDEFVYMLEGLANKEVDGPCFFFVHEKIDALPMSLMKRLEIYGATDFCEDYSDFTEDMFVWKKFRLPSRRELKQAGRCKSRLYEIYDAELFKCPFDPTSKTYSFLPSEHGDKVFLIHHNLNELELKNGSAGDLKLLLEFYIGEFGQQIYAELGARLAIIFSCQYVGDRADYQGLFDELAKDARFADRVKNITAMDDVTIDYVENWRQKVFEHRGLFPKQPDLEQLFPFGEEEKKSMKEIQEILVDQLIQYNQQIK